ncbi:GNAT family N-acetyltransferase [Dasania sp. GY-MA-18]|uniref:GNAT family N-acetyltransferase n=1 Tax=Dasania phycosphaerae TaxID=2950436 RepID=A0A9J6RLR5_9GAMM|nr:MULTISPECIES: GNAT family N-acetyltransferase [Dasania]MCR8922957.1 GNAT family N-acetyltransferase [Dasania sp. GY-MA-18]MCZ0865388.1 GNAT family N-acetyltransferase [Dasania phycosphaerae]MCZ0869113.1 GNAT family N-acetyltransferase [Dasania phycosphaerae]
MMLSVSPLLEQDRNDWEALYCAYVHFYNMPMDDEILDTIWSWIFDGEQDFYCLLAKDEQGKGIGFMHYRAMPSPIRGQMVGFLDDLFVQPECRGSGVVDLLFDTLHDSAKDKGWPFIRWITADNNYRGRAVYDKLAEKTQWQTYQMTVE